MVCEKRNEIVIKSFYDWKVEDGTSNLTRNRGRYYTDQKSQQIKTILKTNKKNKLCYLEPFENVF